MRNPRLMVIVGLASAALLAACGGQSATIESPASEAVPAAFSDREASGEDLANAWFELLSMTGAPAGEFASDSAQVQAGIDLVRPYLDPAFTLVRSSGERYFASNYVPLDVDDYEVSDVVVTQPRDDIRVVRYTVSTPGATAPDTGIVMSGDFAPRLTVLKWDEALGRWAIVSHANFNTPLAAVCDASPIEMGGDPAQTSAEDFALGEQLVVQWRDITTGKSQERVRHPEAQIQLADGRAWPTADDKPLEWKPAQAYDYADLSITRDGDLLVASYDAVVSDLVMEGEEYRASASPRLLTYLQSPEGKWELIALANFTVPQEIPADVDCASLGS